MFARFSCCVVAFALVLAATSSVGGEKPGKSIHPRSLDEIKKKLASIVSPDDKNVDENTEALRKLRAYRYLAELPYEDVTLDVNYNKMCVAGARLCEKIGKADHKPKNPGLPEDEYKLAFKGTSQSNLAVGYRKMVEAIDGWMEDSDEGNIATLGHRRWCLSPALQKTGFGREGEYSAMFTFDASRKKIPNYDMICYPARGYMPIEYFGASHAWSVTLNPKKYKAPAKGYEPKVYVANDKGLKTGDPLPLNCKNVDRLSFGVPNCIIFRPEKLVLKAGARFVVELEGIQPTAAQKAVTLSYVVEFVSGK
jgi:hypothetical protein